MTNFSYLFSVKGIFKLFTTVLGACAAYACIDAYLYSSHNKGCRGENSTLINATSKISQDNFDNAYCDFLWMEAFSIFGVAVFTIISTVFLVTFTVVKSSAENKLCRAIDFGFHFFGGIVLIVCGIFMGYSVLNIEEKICGNIVECQNFYEKVAGAGLIILSAILSLAVSYSVNTMKYYYEEPEVV